MMCPLVSDKVISIPEEVLFCFVFLGVEYAFASVTDKACLSK